MATHLTAHLTIQDLSSIHDKQSSIHKSTPPFPPQLQPQLTVLTTTVVTEKEVLSMDKVFPPNSDEWNQWEMVKVLVQRQEASEESLAIHNKGALIKCHIAPSACNIDLNSPRGFRLLLSQIGFLLPKNRNHITPLHISDSVISEMETLDMLNERGCISPYQLIMQNQVVQHGQNL
ncbi:unnamed protein product [Mucor circinelloides]